MCAHLVSSKNNGHRRKQKLPFFVVLTTRNPDGTTIGHASYRYSHANPRYHPDQIKAHGIKRNTHSRIQYNVYCKGQINKALIIRVMWVYSQNTRGLNHEDKDNLKWACLPYIKVTTDKVGRGQRKHDTNRVFKPHKIINNSLRSSKDKIHMHIRNIQSPIYLGFVYHWWHQTTYLNKSQRPYKIQK